MTPDKGGLWVQPGSHKHRYRHVRVENHRVYQGTPESPVSISAQAGDAVIFSSRLLHSTTPNVTQDTRWAYVIEYMSIKHFDPGIEPPYLVVARNGQAQAEFVNFYQGRLNPLNHLKYLGFRWGVHWSALRDRLARLSQASATEAR